jgi:lipoprotein-releasing system ATP-binding protein
MRSNLALSVANLEHSFAVEGSATKRVEVLRGVSIDLMPGEVLAVLGPSGSGKSTLLHLLARLETPTAGTVRWGDTDTATLSQERLAARRAQEVGLIFQHHYLLEDLTVLQNAMLPGMIAGRADETRARSLLKRVGLTDKAQTFPRVLSGGERQRAALARALCTKPRLVLADEPTGSLDRHNADMVFGMLLELAHSEGAGVVVVTHDESLARRADGILRLEDGRIVARETPARPA